MIDVKNIFEAILEEEKVKEVLAFLKADDSFSLEEQLEMCQIPSLPLANRKRLN